ncbi:hypothetical protein IVB40_13460 [Bradyrhizobium sp. 40]|uniref:hypothetical protein n=1 Tax=Bradyrhizobium sp. 40 TaxID=2782674 RepID=UPI001FFECE1E|nr:hypothetical protein [Bradyrhizobium sp. 40]UPJ44950.1 hypothetical protein IVB40_13460 [Bradyrhizobium sp. 40]
MLSRLERIRQTRIYGLASAVVIAFACLYAVMIAVDGLKYVGPTFSLVSYTLRSLKADALDAISVFSYKLTGKGLGTATRPTRFALICESEGTNETDNAIGEKQVRGQLVDNKGGYSYANMMSEMREGREQPIFVLTKNGPGGTRFCAVKSYYDQECTCGGQYKAKERARISAYELFGPPKPIH